MNTVSKSFMMRLEGVVEGATHFSLDHLGMSADAIAQIEHFRIIPFGLPWAPGIAEMTNGGCALRGYYIPQETTLEQFAQFLVFLEHKFQVIQIFDYVMVDGQIRQIAHISAMSEILEIITPYMVH